MLDALGRKTEADAALEGVTSRNGDQYACQIALICAARNDRVSAFKWLDRSYLQHDATPVYLRHDPLLKHLEGDPRYRDFLRKDEPAEVRNAASTELPFATVTSGSRSVVDPSKSGAIDGRPATPGQHRSITTPS